MPSFSVRGDEVPSGPANPPVPPTVGRRRDERSSQRWIGWHERRRSPPSSELPLSAARAGAEDASFAKSQSDERESSRSHEIHRRSRRRVNSRRFPAPKPYRKVCVSSGRRSSIAPATERPTQDERRSVRRWQGRRRIRPDRFRAKTASHA